MSLKCSGSPLSSVQAGQLLCCLSRKKKPEREGTDRVEIAFRRLDINGDGYIDRTEFQKVCSL